MKINIVEQKGYSNRIMDWKVFVRQNLTVVKASEFFYEFVGENSFRPVSELILPEDGELLKEAIQAHPFQKLEIMTVLSNLKDSVRNVYMRLEQSEQTEKGTLLYQITIADIHDLEGRNIRLEENLIKYRHFMTLEDVYFFEYLSERDHITVYKYVNERAMGQFEGSLNDLIRQVSQAREDSNIGKAEERLRAFCAHLRNGEDFFEMELLQGEDGELWKVRGSKIPKNRSMMAGIMIPDRNREKEAYYLTPAARDAGTGLLNKRAMTEYTIEQLNQKDGHTRWLVIIDIDDFKHINDTFGHIFGDRVIRGAAETMQELVGQRGAIGRFGGDEYVVLLEKVETREQLKTLLKTIAKELALAFDPKTCVTASIGVSEYPVDGTEYEELMRKADKALYLAKEKGKNRHIIYEERLHGKLEADDMQNMAMAYAVSKEKKREVITEMITDICLSGVEAIVKNSEKLQQIRSLFDLDGITIYADRGKELVSRNGNYMAEAPDGRPGFEDPQYLSLFGEDDIFVESNMVKLRSQCPSAYAVAQKQEIGAALQCLSRKDGIPYVMVNYEMFNRNRKWSDEDITLLTILGRCIGNLLCCAGQSQPTLL